MIHAAYVHVVLFDWMIEELVDRHPDIDRAIIERIAADTWFHVDSYFPRIDSMAADRICGLGLKPEKISHLPIKATAGDYLDMMDYPEE